MSKERHLPSNWSIDGAGNCWFAADLKTKSVKERTIADWSELTDGEIIELPLLRGGWLAVDFKC